MSRRPLRTAFVLVLALVSIAASCAPPTPQPSTERPAPDPGAVVAAITEEGLLVRLKALAEATGPEAPFRAVSSAGYDRAATLVEEDLRAAGWTVAADAYTGVAFVDEGGSLVEVAGRTFEGATTSPARRRAGPGPHRGPRGRGGPPRQQRGAAGALSGAARPPTQPPARPAPAAPSATLRLPFECPHPERSTVSDAPARPRTLVEKIWDDHVVAQDEGSPVVLAIDLHLVHEVTSPQAFTSLRARGLSVRRPERTVATADHSTPTTPRGLPILDQMAATQVKQLEANCAEFGIPIHAYGSETQGIVHVIGPELGLTQPGMTIVCGDSHTATHGAFGALAFGIGTSEVEMVLATQTLLQRRPKTYEVRVDGRLRPGVGAKDIILALIARIGIGGGTGHVFEYRGEAIRALSMEQRMTICNMSIEGGARAGLVAPDDTTFEYVHGRRHAPQGAAWDEAVARWRTLPTDEGATFDTSITLDANTLEPMITWGTNPGMGIPISGRVPRPEEAADPAARRAYERALEYMGLQAGQPIAGQPVEVVFIGSCTNSRISDLRLAASVLEGRHAADGVRLMVVPGSQQVKAQAEREGLHEIFRAAGAEWRDSGCSMCIAMNGDQLAPGQYAVSTSNRNFEGRQGRGGRTLLASPLTAAATAIAGVVTDPRTLPGIEQPATVGGGY